MNADFLIHQELETPIPIMVEEELTWKEPVQRVQALAEKGLKEVPPSYIRPVSERPFLDKQIHLGDDGSIPVIDFSGLEDHRREDTMDQISRACEEWGFFQLINHCVPVPVMDRTVAAAREFFDLPLEEKQVYANKPWSLVGYGSRIGVTEGAILDWGDYFLHYLWPLDKRDVDQEWPRKPASYVETLDEYTHALHNLCSRLLEALSESLGLRKDYIGEIFGWPDTNLVLRINYYPPCPSPDLTLGVGSHSDGGVITFLLHDNVPGLQVRKGDRWLLLEPIPNAIVVNIADQLQILSNGRFKSVEHRVAVNKDTVRMSLATFCNPDVDTIIAPAEDLVNDDNPVLYRAMTYGEFLESLCRDGLKGKDYVESFRR
ncbi:oxidoreductase [Selaginella moellendorffii]|uniref:Oxidoreductase n=1 Tax=Selaginella moellendorffii TaxID=88036 RepID=D8QWF8_SELML|nr:probable 2-oxoglutarate-dependent dioxygenase ANS [Selaginella moellendorffii]EFJ35224.1 oxidoreductase [Selaginella moellendorffii]|eukprot:XP_024524031.1 probable 2-oxoglutarate-dependent dioxygenase ANS [Selaginella moellendorffii]